MSNSNDRFANQDADAPTPCSFSNFQQIFQEMKAENPTASMGAVQQMTMRRLSELQRLKVEEQDHLRKLADKAETEEEHVLGLAAKTLNKFVDAIRVAAPDEGEDQNIKAKASWNRSPLNDSQGSNSDGDRDGGLLSLNSFRMRSCDEHNIKTKASWNRSPLNDSQGSTSDGDRDGGLLSFKSFRRPSSVSGPKRQDSKKSAHEFNESNESLFRSTDNISKARTANEMYAIAANEQGANMAPRKSIGDFTAMLSVGDASEGTRDSLKSLKSDFSELLLEELANNFKSEEMNPTQQTAVAGNGSSEFNYSEEVLAAYELCIGESTKLCTTERQNGNRENENAHPDQWIDQQLEHVASRIASSSVETSEENCDLNHSRHSDTKSAISGLSGISDCTSACGDGLIVGFKPRNQCTSSVDSKLDEDHLHGGNFASDFSAWER
jgi:hypothetical protein